LRRRLTNNAAIAAIIEDCAANEPRSNSAVSYQPSAFSQARFIICAGINNRLSRAANNKQTAIQRAENLMSNETEIKDELDDLNKTANYAQGVASVASVYVRFYKGDATIPAEIK
jgi:hypothetical protein